MLFNYNKGNGLKNGLTIGDTPIGSLFKNNNLQLLNQGNNRKFLSDISEDFSEYNSENISNLAKKYKDVDAAVIKFAQDQKLANASGKELIQTFEMQGTALYKFKGVMQGLGDSVGKILASIGNAVVSMGISIAASLIIAGIQKIVNHAKELHEEVQNITSTYSETTKKLVDNRKEFDELSQKYNELSDGVNALGQNVSLTESEFEEYHTITNKIADMVPDLVSGWDEQGNAILRVKGNVEGLSQAYDEEMIKANNAIIKDSDKITKDTKKQIKKLGGQEEFDDLSLLNDVLSGKLDITPESDLNKIVDTLIKSGVDVGVGMESLDKIYDFGDDQEYAKALSIYLKNLSTDEKNIISAYVKEHEATLSDGMSSARELLKSEISNNQLQDYKNLNDELKSVMNSIANTISDEELYKLSQGKGGKNGNQDIGQYVEELYSTLSKLPQADLKDIEAGINLSTQWNNDEIPYDEYIQKVQAFVELLETLFPDNKDIVETFKVLFDIPTEEEISQTQDIFVNRLGKKKMSGNSKTSLQGMPSDVEDKLKNQYTEVADTWYDSLTKSQREFVDNISDEDLAEAVKFDSTEQFDEWLKKCQNEAVIEADVTIKSSDAVNSMADMKKAVGSLDDLYGQIVKGVTSEGLANGFADPDLLNNVESSFYKFSEELKKEGNDAAANEINLALEKFEDTLVKFPNDAEKAQASIDELITAYIDQTDVIKNLTEENAEWSTAQLKAMGITNAEEVVQSRLSAQIKETQEALSDLSKELLKYNDALNGTDEEAKADAIANLVSPTRDALANRDKAGKILEGQQNAFLDNINEGFVQSHLADIQAMAEGDINALNRVRMAAAEGAVMEVTTNVPTDVAEQQIQGLMDMVAQADAMNIEPGASINDASFYDHLNQMVRSGQTTVEAVNAAFSAMGYEAKWKSNRSIVRVPNGAHVTTVYGGPNAGQAIHWDFKDETVDFPSLDIITKKGGSGGGATAHYSGSPARSSGGGGGGGGNSGGGGGGSNSASEPTKPQEEAEDTFDWIEVAIQRIEEEINRLDEVVNNSYTTWTKRNSALVKELQKTKDEIKAQAIAQQEYQRYLKTIKINNGKGLNADDYGENDQLVKQRDQKLLDEAKRLWATGQYQKKIQNGQMTGNDIEKIQNHFLVDAINEYKEM